MCRFACRWMLIFLFSVQLVSAATFNVNTTSDLPDQNPGDGICAAAGGGCSLRAAVNETNALAGSDSINLPAGTYTLTNNGSLHISSSLTILGAGAATTFVETAGGNASVGRVFLIQTSGVVDISGVTIQKGNALKYGTGLYPEELFGTADGGGIQVFSGTLNLFDSVVTQNLGANASGIQVVSGTLSLQRVRVTGNTATLALGAAVRVGTSGYSGAVSFDNVEVSGNLPANFAGVMLRAASSGQINNSLFDTQSIQGMDAAQLNLINTTQVNAMLSNTGPIMLRNVTQIGGSAFVGPGASLQAQNTILLGTCSTITSLGNNVVTSACPTGNGADLITTAADPTFSPLQQTVGFTRTIQLLPGNVGIDAANPAACPATDQRGISRPHDGDNDGVAICDIGAYELAPFAQPTMTAPASPANNNSPMVNGIASPNATVAVFLTSNCTGASFNTTSNANGAFSVSVAVNDNTTYVLSATVPLTSAPCLAGVSYTEDSIPPAVPAQLATNPVSPSAKLNIIVTGTADAGSMVRLYSNSACSGAPIATVVANSSNEWQANATVPGGSTTNFSANASDAASNVSGCSSPVTYVNAGPNITITGIKANEGSGINTIFNFPVTLSEATDVDIRIAYVTQNDTALSTFDYIAASGVVTVKAGQTSAVVPITVIGDRTAESNETFFVNLSKQSAGVITTSRATGLIINDDSVGEGAVIPNTASVTTGNAFEYIYTWTVPPTAPNGSPSTWRDLRTLSLRFRTGNTVILEILWDQATNDFALFNQASNKPGPAFQPGSKNVLQTPYATLYLQQTSATGGGPTSPLVTLKLQIAFKPNAAGSFTVEGAATDDFGQEQPWTPLGTISVTKGH